MLEEVLSLGIIFTGFIVLLVASYTDVKTRTAPNTLWLIMGSIGILILIIRYFFIGIILNQIIIIPIMFAMAIILFRIGIIFGGADAKALMALSVLTPFWPHLGDLPLCESLMPFPWVIFSNAVLLFLFIPPALLVFNILHKNMEFPYSLLGYKMKTNKAKEKHVWPLERISKGERKLIMTPIDIDVLDQIEKLEAAGKKEIWVTPKIPFMIPLLLGFILAFTLGDILFYITSLFL